MPAVTMNDVKTFIDKMAPNQWVRRDGDGEASLAQRMGTTWEVLNKVLPGSSPRSYLSNRLGKYVSRTLIQAERHEKYNHGTWFCVQEKADGSPADQLGVNPNPTLTLTLTLTPTLLSAWHSSHSTYANLPTTIPHK